MFRRSNILSDPNASLAALKDRICYAVEQEVQNELNDFEVTDELYIETSFKAWERFYSCCEQYHIKSTQPIGLVNLEPIGAVTVIKKSAYSLLRPCELLEHLMLVGESDEYIHLNDLILDDDISSEDLIKLVVVLAMLEQNISDEFKAEIDMKLYELNTPNDLVSKIFSEYGDNVSTGLCLIFFFLNYFLNSLQYSLFFILCTVLGTRSLARYQSTNEPNVKIAENDGLAFENASNERCR